MSRRARSISRYLPTDKQARNVAVPNGLAFGSITLHHSLTEIDLLCSVPMMKTHVLATVTLGMKNLIGLYLGTVYYSVTSWLHGQAANAQSPGIAFEIIDMVRANKLGLVVVAVRWQWRERDRGRETW